MRGLVNWGIIIIIMTLYLVSTIIAGNAPIKDTAGVASYINEMVLEYLHTQDVRIFCMATRLHIRS